MPSQKKQTKHTKNKNNRMRINFHSRKVQALFVILIFALGGAGWFTYRTYASYYDVTSRTFKVGSGLSPRIEGTTCSINTNVTEPQKNNMRIALLGCNPKPKQTGRATISVNLTLGNIPSASPQGQIRTCYYLKGAGDFTAGSYFNKGAWQLGHTADTSKVNSQSYTEVCTPYITLKDVSKYNPYVVLRGSKTGLLSVSTVRVDFRNL